MWLENFPPTTTALRIGNASRWQSHPLTNTIKVASRISEDHYY
jgi:hypothetical protein